MYPSAKFNLDITAGNCSTLVQVLAFSAALEARKITVSVRQTRGLDANAACGQLRNEFQKTPLVEEVPEPQLEMAVAS